MTLSPIRLPVGEFPFLAMNLNLLPRCRTLANIINCSAYSG
jgi:hypothetical protein